MLEDYKFLSDSFEEKKIDGPSLTIVAFKPKDNDLLKSKIEQWFSIEASVFDNPDKFFGFLNKNQNETIIILNEDQTDEEFFRAIRVSGKKSKVISFSPNLGDWERLKVSLEGLLGNESQGLGLTEISLAMKVLLKNIRILAKKNSPILICGPVGSGKKTAANIIHKLSSRSHEELVQLNLSVFGQSSVINEREIFRLTNSRGTYYLQNIEDLPSVLRGKVLALLNSPVEGPRLFLGTTLNLDSFREREPEIYNLIGDNIINIPPLSQRREDIVVIIQQFIGKYSAIHNSKGTTIDDDALKALVEYSWPCNVLELENLIERLVILHGGIKIFRSDLPEKLLKNVQNSFSYELPSGGLNLKYMLAEIEGSLMAQALSRCKGNKNRAAKLLGLNRTTLVEKLKKRKTES
jgi:DNA-binding NtrC family response regulator